ncbi:MAG: U4/U5/U6 small nuclear ribonucleoprotein prp3 [Ramalina farinacea]|uniref:U4/U5/U6 small nuclear ribonucleoprotein prp3 n=1 Tax=Ramalina farinacea TaxID=258253 RepID=A0AA43QKK0_9LECA|nr:U4/U5/U6 small nuclear ribonucleoprotein prp3 [Ramalina farinacea]
MAEAQTANGVKRPHPPDGSQQDDQKRIRSNTGSPSVPANGVPSSKPDISKAVAEARARAQNAANRRNATQTPGINGAAHSPSPGPDAPSGRPMSKIEEMKARVAALTSKSKAAAQPALSPFSPPPFDDAFSRQRGGLSAALHPSLLDAGKDAASKNASQPRYPAASKPTTKAPGKGKKQLDLTGPNIEEFRQNNPYFDSSLGGQTATLKTRNPKQLKFNEKGKYIQQAASMRRLEALEAMRKRIAASSKKALIEEDVAEKKFIIEAPPEIEWWDEGLVANTDKGYEDITTPNGLKIDSSDSIITRLIQHPALILPPADRLIPAPKPMYLTTQEQKKIRRQRRMANLKETQAKIRLGLQEPPPDKVKLGNLMRVLGTEAVKDPTAVEAQVTRQIAERKQGHEQMNEERKLNKDEKHEKLETKQAADVAKGIYLSVYKIDSLANGRHRFKVGKNCEQLGGTGLCIYSPKFCLVLVEFGQHGARAYKKLMLNRIDWTENSPAPVREGNKEAQVAFLAAEDEKTGQVKDLSGNKCQLLFEGQEKDQMFRKWATKVCETEKEAMDALARTKMDTFWTMAKGMP